MRKCTLRTLKDRTPSDRYDNPQVHCKGEGEMSGIILFVPAIAALGAAIWLALFGQALNGKTLRRARVAVRLTRRG